MSQQDLPFVGSSHQFVGAERGGVNISAFLLSAPPGRGLRRVDGEEFEAGAGDIP